MDVTGDGMGGRKERVRERLRNLQKVTDKSRKTGSLSELKIRERIFLHERRCRKTRQLGNDLEGNQTSD